MCGGGWRLVRSAFGSVVRPALKTPGASRSTRTTSPASSRARTGPEAGVWVIAETDGHADQVPQDRRDRRRGPVSAARSAGAADLRALGARLRPRRFAAGPRDAGAARRAARPSSRPIARAAAQIYPANYWYSLIEIPAESEFPGTGATGNGIEPGMAHAASLDQSDQERTATSAISWAITRRASFPRRSARFESSYDAWDHRTQVGQDGTAMIAAIDRLGRKRGLDDVRRLDGSDRGRRGAAGAAAPAGSSSAISC